MGLDGVELVMEVEDHFRVALPDEDCARVQTVGELAALVGRELAKVTAPCPTARAFYALRQAVASCSGLPHRALRPRTRLDAVFPAERRRRLWRAQRAATRHLPDLVHTPRADRYLSALGWALFVAWLVTTVLLFYHRGCAGAGAGLLLGLLAVIIDGLALSYLATEFPADCTTLGDLARRLTPAPVPADTPEARQRILDGVRQLTSAQLGTPIEKVLPESRFVEDLGMD